MNIDSGFIDSMRPYLDKKQIIEHRSKHFNNLVISKDGNHWHLSRCERRKCEASRESGIYVSREIKFLQQKEKDPTSSNSFNFPLHAFMERNKKQEAVKNAEKQQR